jgi:hypothetical protein
VFTAQYALSPYIKQMGFVFKGLIAGVIQKKDAALLKEIWNTLNT